MRRSVTLLASIVALLLGGVFFAPAAQADTYGTGYGENNPNYMGSYVAPDGRHVYCVDFGPPAPLGGPTTGPTTTSTFVNRAGVQLTPGDLAHLNYALSRWGDTSDPDVAAALQFYVWSVGDSVAWANAGGLALIDSMTGVVAPSRTAVIRALFSQITAETNAYALTDPSVSISVTMNNDDDGVLTVTTNPSGLAGQVVLTNAVFAADGSSTALLGSGTYPLIGAAPAGVLDFDVSATITAQAWGYGGLIDYYEIPGAGLQRLVTVASHPLLLTDEDHKPIAVQFQPTAETTLDKTVYKIGTPITDMVEVSASIRPWLVDSNGAGLPVVFEGTAYLAGDVPPVQSSAVPADAVVIDTVTITADGPGTYSSPAVTATDPGFITWVWTLRTTAQAGWVQPHIRADWTSDFGIVQESASVQHKIDITSQVREYNVLPGGRIFDRITQTGFPDDHGNFTGAGPWGADVTEVVHTVYGPVPSDTDLTDGLDLSTVPVVATLTTPAVNGVFPIGYDAGEEIVVSASGFYVIVSTFAGDDRVEAFQSRTSDVRERVMVPRTPTPPTTTTFHPWSSGPLAHTGAQNSVAFAWLAGALLVSGLGTLAVSRRLGKHRRSA